MPKYQPRTGRDAIEEAAAAKGGSGNFRSFVPEIKWREDGSEKYILVLTPIDEVATLDLHEWIPIGKREKANGEEYTVFESFLSRKDPLIGEDYDDLEGRLGRSPKTRCYGVAVELEPVLETIKGRQRPKGFVVKTDTYERNTDDGKVEVTQPVIGLVIQSAALVWSPLGSYDEEQGPLIDLPLKITRRGTDRNTRYDMIPFVDAPVDLSPVVDFVDGLSFLGEVLDDVQAEISAAGDDSIAQAQAVARALYDRRLEELADKERYDELVTPLEEIPDKFGGGKKKASGNGSSRPARPTRQSPRQSSETAAPASDDAKFARLKERIEKR